MNPDQHDATRRLMLAVADEAMIVHCYEDDRDHVYLWGSHDVGAPESFAAIQRFATETGRALSEVIIWFDDAAERWVHPAGVVIDDVDLNRLDLVLDAYRDGYVPVLCADIS